MEIAVMRGRVAWPVALFVIALLVFMAAGYLAGFFSVLGYENRHVTFHGAATGTKSGGGFGLKHMVFLEGQTFYVQYDAEVIDGSFRIGILKTFGPIGNKPHFVRPLTASGKGEVTYRIPESGVYSVYFNGSVLGDGHTGRYDVRYAVVWGAR